MLSRSKLPKNTHSWSVQGLSVVTMDYGAHQWMNEQQWVKSHSWLMHWRLEFISEWRVKQPASTHSWPMEGWSTITMDYEAQQQMNELLVSQASLMTYKCSEAAWWQWITNRKRQCMLPVSKPITHNTRLHNKQEKIKHFLKRAMKYCCHHEPLCWSNAEQAVLAGVPVFT